MCFQLFCLHFFSPHLMDIMKVAVAAKPPGVPLSTLANSEGFSATCDVKN